MITWTSDFLLLPPNSWDSKYILSLLVYVVLGTESQDFVNAREALNQLNYLLSLEWFHLPHGLRRYIAHQNREGIVVGLVPVHVGGNMRNML